MGPIVGREYNREKWVLHQLLLFATNIAEMADNGHIYFVTGFYTKLAACKNKQNEKTFY